MNNPIETPNDAWEACPPGELQRLVHDTRLHRRARVIRQSVLTGGAATIVVLLAWVAVSQVWLTPHCIAGLYCEEVRREIPELVAMRVEPKRAAQLHQHIALCRDCRQLMQQLQDKRPMSFKHPRHHDRNCPYCKIASQLALGDTPPHNFPSLFP